MDKLYLAKGDYAEAIASMFSILPLEKQAVLLRRDLDKVLQESCTTHITDNHLGFMLRLLNLSTGML